MKKVLTVGIGRRSFIINEDAYAELDRYLEMFKSKVKMGVYTKEVMDDLEDRIADLFSESIRTSNEVVSMELVKNVISRLGMPDDEPAGDYFSFSGNGESCERITKKFFRDPCDKKIGGVCSGIAAYLDIDVLLVRIVFIIALFIGTAGFWIYMIVWFVAPLAKTAAQRCEMRGLPVTVENMKKYSSC